MPACGMCGCCEWGDDVAPPSPHPSVAINGSRHRRCSTARPPARPAPPSLTDWSHACRFDELARLCDPAGKMTRTDRISIVQGAVRCGGMRVRVRVRVRVYALHTHCCQLRFPLFHPIRRCPRTPDTHLLPLPPVPLLLPQTRSARWASCASRTTSCDSSTNSSRSAVAAAASPGGRWGGWVGSGVDTSGLFKPGIDWNPPVAASAGADAAPGDGARPGHVPAAHGRHSPTAAAAAAAIAGPAAAAAATAAAATAAATTAAAAAGTGFRFVFAAAPGHDAGGSASSWWCRWDRRRRLCCSGCCPPPAARHVQRQMGGTRCCHASHGSNTKCLECVSGRGSSSRLFPCTTPNGRDWLIGCCFCDGVGSSAYSCVRQRRRRRSAAADAAGRVWGVGGDGGACWRAPPCLAAGPRHWPGPEAAPPRCVSSRSSGMRRVAVHHLARHRYRPPLAPRPPPLAWGEAADPAWPSACMPCSSPCHTSGPCLHPLFCPAALPFQHALALRLSPSPLAPTYHPHAGAPAPPSTSALSCHFTVSPHTSPAASCYM